MSIEELEGGGGGDHTPLRGTVTCIDTGGWVWSICKSWSSIAGPAL